METTDKPKRTRKPDPRKGDRHLPRRALWLNEVEALSLDVLAKRQGKRSCDLGREIVRDALRAAGLWTEPEPSPPIES